MNPFSRLLYPILDASLLKQRSIDPFSVVEMWLSLDLDWFQLRYKGYGDSAVLSFAETLKKRFPSSSLIANDRAPLLFDSSQLFSGLHLGQEDMLLLTDEDKEKLKIIKAERDSSVLIGISTHNQMQVDQALHSPPFPMDYFAIGPCFSTVTKTLHDPLLQKNDRLKMMRSAEKRAAPFLVTIGGITSKNISELLQESPFQAESRSPVIAVIQSALDYTEMLSIGNYLTRYRNRPTTD